MKFTVWVPGAITYPERFPQVYAQHTVYLSGAGALSATVVNTRMAGVFGAAGVLSAAAGRTHVPVPAQLDGGGLLAAAMYIGSLQQPVQFDGAGTFSGYVSYPYSPLVSFAAQGSLSATIA